ncbi:MAG: metalloregulator ArsR/SmtB family transcription factor [Solobacterium sp.]|jgi:DNA-binding transcriptional ArsR family regulator|nr:metalloregulator ArsR/SmtB family transcription factor [Solobacterium sp.]MCH4223105.1 metalloregulator ArsR/SmtB family transcription factor [Solobacterium sp.]MCH4265090.1 metalloregulator ArsR/SmtB family transcription factor [Solobacterium sp.]
MNECAASRRQLAEEFLNYKSVFLALGDETRQQILLALLEHETVGMRVGEITCSTHLSRPAVSHHLKILMDARLISMHRSGTRNYYYVDANLSCWNGLKELIEHISDTVNHANACGYPGMKEE